jgi:hypothetical protein
MKRFVVREVETLKTTAAFYGCDCCCQFIIVETDDCNFGNCCGPAVISN